MSTSRASSKSNVGAGANRSDSGSGATNSGASSMSGAGTGAIIGSIIGGAQAHHYATNNPKNPLQIAKSTGFGAMTGASIGASVGTLADKFTHHKKMSGAKRGAIIGALAFATPIAVDITKDAGIIENKNLGGKLILAPIITGVGAGVGAGTGALVDKFRRYKRDRNKTNIPST